MPSPQFKRQAINAPDAPPVRPNLFLHFESILLMALCIFLGFVLPLLLRSSFDGVWFRTSGDQNAPAEIKLLAHRGKFSEIIPIDCFGSYETITLIADSREHDWSGPSPGCRVSVEPGVTSYSAQLTSNSFKLTKRASSATFTESWDLVGHGRMVISAHGQTATYHRASWLRSLFTEEP
jgi:hypothetical protein